MNIEYDNPAHSAPVSFSPDRKKLAINGTLWDFDLNYLLEHGCDWVRRYLKNNPNVQSDRFASNHQKPTHYLTNVLKTGLTCQKLYVYPSLR